MGESALLHLAPDGEVRKIKTIYFAKVRRPGKGRRTAVVLSCFFAIGFFLGFFYSGGSPGGFPLGALVQAQFFCGPLADCEDIAAALPRSTEREGDGDLRHWDVSYYDDDLTGEEIPVFVNTVTTEEGEATTTTDLVKVPQESLALTALKSDTPKVLIYSTHTSEGYSDGGTVVDVAKALKENLEAEYGIGAVVSEKVHDSPEWYKSYANSRQTAKEMLDTYTEAQLIIDLHRDSGVTKAASTLDVAGSNVASLLLVVGSNLTMEHPNWEENLATAEKVGDCITKVNGDILKGVRVQKGRYNQHLTSKAILLEVGTNLNTLDEAKASTKIVAQAINDYLDSGA